MKTLQSINLLKGQYNPKEAKEILLDIIVNQINFHKLKNLSSRVRFERPDAESEKRIQELQEAKDKITSIIQKALKEDVKLKIESNITISREVQDELNGISSSEESIFIETKQILKKGKKIENEDYSKKSH